MLRSLIVDDEPLAREGLAEYVNQVDFLALNGQAEDPVEALRLLQEGAIDLMFLDIQMPKLNGMEFLKTLADPPLVIVTTAYPSFALEGFQLNVLDYLVKPVTFQRFLQAALRAQEQHQLLQPQRTPETQQEEAPYIFVKVDGRFERIELNRLLYVEGMQNYVQLHTESGKRTPLISLKQMEDKLPGRQFLRVHKSYIVNIEKVQSIEGNQLVIGSERVPVSRSKVDEISRLILGDRLIN